MELLPDTLMMPPETRLQPGAAYKTLDWCAEFGTRGLLVCGHSLERSGRLETLMGNRGHCQNLSVWQHPGGEPTLDQLEALLGAARAHDPHWIVAIGGGSVMDIAKAAAGLLDAPLSITAYHDGEAIPPSHRAFIAVPTTAGTGSEATIVSVLTNKASGVKKSIRHASFMARLVVLDPDLLEDCPPAILAAAGLDALTQAIESYCSNGATWLTDTLALKASSLIHANLESVYQGDARGRASLLSGSYLAGIALSNARLGIVHGLAHPLGARYAVPHGLACAICLPHALTFNREAIPEKYEQLSAAVGGDLCACVNRLLDRLGLHSPFAGKPVPDRAAVIAETLASGSTKANPRPVSAMDVSYLLDCIFDATT